VWSLNHPFRIPPNQRRNKWCVPVSGLELGSWGLVPPPIYLEYHRVRWESSGMRHLGNCHRQQKRGGNFWFLSPSCLLFMDYILHMSFHIRKQGSTLNMPIAAIELTKLFCGHWVRHCFRPKCYYL
jgi:hypothetical protein